MAEQEHGDPGPEAQPEPNAYDRAVARQKELQDDFERRRERDLRLHIASSQLAALIVSREKGSTNQHLVQDALAWADALIGLADGKASK